MGITRFSGPVYGAKGTLISVSAQAPSTGATTSALAAMVVPVYETWYLTEAAAYVGTTLASNIKVKVKGTSTSATFPTAGPDPNFPTGNPSTGIANVSLASASPFVTITGTPGEYEGYAAPGNSSIRIVSTGASTMTNLTVWVRGFIRYLDSTRAV